MHISLSNDLYWRCKKETKKMCVTQIARDSNSQLYISCNEIERQNGQ